MFPYASQRFRLLFEGLRLCRRGDRHEFSRPAAEGVAGQLHTAGKRSQLRSTDQAATGNT